MRHVGPPLGGTVKPLFSVYPGATTKSVSARIFKNSAQYASVSEARLRRRVSTASDSERGSRNRPLAEVPLVVLTRRCAA